MNSIELHNSCVLLVSSRSNYLLVTETKAARGFEYILPTHQNIRWLQRELRTFFLEMGGDQVLLYEMS